MEEQSDGERWRGGQSLALMAKCQSNWQITGLAEAIRGVQMVYPDGCGRVEGTVVVVVVIVHGTL